MFVITGGGSGIGQALAIALAKREQQVLIIGRREQALRDTAKFSNHINYCSADVSSTEGRQRVVQALAEIDSLQGLVHNAGIVDPIVPLAQIDEASWQRVFNTNVNAALFLTQALLSKLAAGRVLHIGSGAAYFPIQGWGAYCASKAALAMLTRCWQLECQQPLFASIMPGITDTDMQALIRKSTEMDSNKHKFFIDLYQQKKLISPDTVALFLCWLLLEVDGKQFAAEEWDIYDTAHHSAWLVPPHQVWSLEP